MDLLIAVLRFAGAVFSFAAEIIRVLSAASESNDEKKEGRQHTELATLTSNFYSGAAPLPQAGLAVAHIVPVKCGVPQARVLLPYSPVRGKSTVRLKRPSSASSVTLPPWRAATSRMLRRPKPW